MKRVQPAEGYAMLHRLLTESKIQELTSPHHSMLSSRQLADPSVIWSLPNTSLS